MCEPVLESRSDKVATLRLNRPKTRNALSRVMIGALQTAIERLGQDAGVHVIILASEGPVFCAGHDLSLIHI